MIIEFLLVFSAFLVGYIDRFESFNDKPDLFNSLGKFYDTNEYLIYCLTTFEAIEVNIGWQNGRPELQFNMKPGKVPRNSKMKIPLRLVTTRNELFLYINKDKVMIMNKYIADGDHVLSLSFTKAGIGVVYYYNNAYHYYNVLKNYSMHESEMTDVKIDSPLLLRLTYRITAPLDHNELCLKKERSSDGSFTRFYGAYSIANDNMTRKVTLRTTNAPLPEKINNPLMTTLNSQLDFIVAVKLIGIIVVGIIVVKGLQYCMKKIFEKYQELRNSSVNTIDEEKKICITSVIEDTDAPIPMESGTNNDLINTDNDESNTAIEDSQDNLAVPITDARGNGSNRRGGVHFNVAKQVITPLLNSKNDGDV